MHIRCFISCDKPKINNKIFSIAKKHVSFNLIENKNYKLTQDVCSANNKSFKTLDFSLKKKSNITMFDRNYKSNLYKFGSLSIKLYSQNHSEFRKVEMHFARLGIEQNFSKVEVKNSFLKLTKIYHPDINKDEGAEKNFQDIKNSYDILISFFDNHENNKIRRKNDMNEKEIEAIVSNIFNKKSNESKSASPEILKNGNDTITKNKEEQIMYDKKIKLLNTINDTLNKNYHSMDIYDLEKLKKRYKKLMLKLERLETAKILLERTKIENNLNFKHILRKNQFSESAFSNINMNQNLEDKVDKPNIQDDSGENVLVKKMKSLFHRIYEIVIKLIVVYCVCAFISYNYSKKIAYFIGFYLVFMIMTS